MDFKSLTDPVVIIGEKSRPSFFKRVREPFSRLSPKFKKAAAVTLSVFLVFAVSLTVYLSQQTTRLTPQASDDGVDLSLNPQTIHAVTNQEFQVDVFVNTGQSGLKLAAVQATINYDPQKLELKDVDLKDFLSVELLAPQNTPGSTKFVVGSNPSSPKEGSGTIATLTFRMLSSSGSTQITFDASKTLVAVTESTTNAVGDMNASTVNYGTDSSPSASPIPSPTLNPNPETSFTLQGPSSVTADQEFEVKVYSRSDIEAANVWVSDITFPEEILEVVRVDNTGSVITSWTAEHFDNDDGEITLVGGIPTPGLKTTNQNVLLSTIVFKGKTNGNANISFTNGAEIFSNTTNNNIVQIKRNISLVVSGANGSPAPSPSQPTASPSPAPSVLYPGKGDGDNNGSIDLRDLSILFSKWSPTNDISSHNQLDFNNDNRINTFDVGAMNNLLFNLGVIRR